MIIIDHYTTRLTNYTIAVFAPPVFMITIFGYGIDGKINVDLLFVSEGALTGFATWLILRMFHFGG